VPFAPPAADRKSAPSQGWHTVSDTDDRFARWNLAATGASPQQDFRQEANTFGYNVEIDPLDPQSVPVKRVSMGRMAHEAAVNSLPVAGQPLAFYMGCDARNEYIYKFVSAAAWDPRDVGGGLAAGDKYLTRAGCSRRASTPTARASGSNSRSPTRASPTTPATASPTRRTCS
jgi:uncharacterized protein